MRALFGAIVEMAMYSLAALGVHQLDPTSNVFNLAIGSAIIGLLWDKHRARLVSGEGEGGQK